MFRRKQLPPSLQPAYDAFAGQVDRLEAARSALMSCLPVGRVEPAPVEVGLDLLADVVAEIASELEAWRHPEVEDAWQGCAAALAESASHVGTAREVAGSSGELEELLGAVADVDEPLGDAFRRAERRFASLRR